MEWWVYVIIAVAVVVAAVLGYMGFALRAFFKAFGRGDDPALDEIDLSHTHYAPYTEKLYSEIAVMRKRPSREVTCTARDGVTLSGDYYANTGAKLAVLVHGYRARAINNFSVSGNSLFAHGYDLLMVHQRAFGRSGGKLTTMGLKERFDILAWLEWVGKNTEIAQVILYGVSMGGYTVSCTADCADGKQVKAIIDDCGYCSPYDEIKYTLIRRGQPYRIIMPFMSLYARLIMHVNLKSPNLPHLAASRVPVMFIHGKADKDVSVSCATTAYAACGAPKSICLVEDAGHTSSFLVDTAAVERTLYDFLDEYIK